MFCHTWGRYKIAMFCLFNIYTDVQWGVFILYTLRRDVTFNMDIDVKSDLESALTCVCK